MTVYESIYDGGGDLLTPKYASSSYQTRTSEIGVALSPFTANQLGELNLKINPGMKTVEIQGVGMQGPGMEAIPEQHLDEIRRLTKLTGVSPSIHAPIIETSGVGERGWAEINRKGAEEQLKTAVLRSHKLNPDGNISVTVHSTASLPEMIQKIKTEKGEETTSMLVIDPYTGDLKPIKPSEEYFPGEGRKFTGKPTEFEPEKELIKFNKDHWTEMISSINSRAAYGGDMINRAEQITERGLGVKPENINNALSEIAKMNIEELPEKTNIEKESIKSIQRELESGQRYLKDAYKNMTSVFDMAYSKAIQDKRQEDVDRLDRFAKEAEPVIKQGIENDPEKIKQFEDLIEKGLKILDKEIKTPELYKPLNNFVIDKSSETFANVATAAYNEFGETAPIINIENPPAGAGLSKAEDLRKLVEESRKKLSENLTKQGMGESEAQKISEKMIGATWDVGHINMLRKFGYSEEDIIKQTKEIAPFVKHMHLSDNFGLDHTELPMGMGNVPIEAIMKELNEKGFQGKKIIEAGDWWTHFAEKGGGNPFKPTIEALNSPIYAMKAGPSWNQVPMGNAYYMGHGPINPSIHHTIYGAGFSSLPSELGGEIQGGQSRFAGTPNQ